MQKDLTCILILLLLIFTFTLPVQGAEDFRESDLDDEIIQSFIDKGSGTDANTLNEILQQPDVLAVYGLIPDKKAGVEAYEWWLLLDEIVTEVANDKEFQKKYMNCIGAHTDGYIYVKIEEGETNIKMKEMETVRQIINTYAAKKGIKDVPFVIKIADEAYTFEQKIENAPQHEKSDSSLKTINETHDNKKGILLKIKNLFIHFFKSS
ncbi:hypothetical protein MmiAt1_15980 [Methanimicrococcus sp. At1]|uniref:Uncharacterized protein n=1 Tax=Methanimicrococcus hacksteinii TaxID=3028293 RepID=A0ABU3VRF8_9EURY|nr:hypothetical protein [Methanimicrococcus sp. At1]MDV0445992.1 hypothetical protein [Methanimicrococcus sp. At1]